MSDDQIRHELLYSAETKERGWKVSWIIHLMCPTQVVYIVGLSLMRSWSFPSQTVACFPLVQQGEPIYIAIDLRIGASLSWDAAGKDLRFAGLDRLAYRE